MQLKSGLERKINSQLKRNKKIKYQYEGISFPYTLTRKYIPDFTITTRSGKIIYVEVKGYLRPQDRPKMVSVKKHNPDIDLRIVFGRNNKLNKNAQMTYTDWADKHSIPWAIGKIPRSWLDE